MLIQILLFHGFEVKAPLQYMFRPLKWHTCQPKAARRRFSRKQAAWAELWNA